jgi:carbonic anhydrase/acetyltransferase-like protein (isoleucine patch superfamily)
MMVIGGLGLLTGKFLPKSVQAKIDDKYTNAMPNVKTSFNHHLTYPDVNPTSYVHPLASVIGNVYIGKRVMVSPCASVRGDEGTPIYLGDNSNVQDCCVVHALETMEGGHEVSKNLFEVNGQKYAVYIGKNVSMAHQSQVHGPAVVGNDTFVGMQALVFKAVVGSNCVIEPGAKVVGVTVADNRYVPMGTVLNTQDAADKLPQITADYPFKKLNAGVVHVNVQLADGYNGKLPPEMAGGKHS